MIKLKLKKWHWIIKNKKMTTKTKRPRINHADKVYKLYCEKGIAEACEYANKHNINYAHCSPCNGMMPTIKEVCLICGQ